MCNKCEHRPVCWKFRTTGGHVNACKDHKEVRSGANISQNNPVDEFICSECGVMLDDFRRIVLDDDGERFYCEVEFQFCPLCGADVRGADID